VRLHGDANLDSPFVENSKALWCGTEDVPKTEAGNRSICISSLLKLRAASGNTAKIPHPDSPAVRNWLLLPDFRMEHLCSLYILLILTYRPMSGRALRNTTAPKSRVTIPTALVMVTIVVFT
jgi:hypothetical protein